MRSQERITWQKETTVLAIVLIIVPLVCIPLIGWSVAEVRIDIPRVRGNAKAEVREEKLAPLSSDEALIDLTLQWENVSPEMILGQAELDLNVLAQAHSIHESDNARWSLVRRTPHAAEVYTPQTGVDWTALRHVSATGTILVPAGFPWSFNETFQQGPGYKQASGILAGGHCALATAFRAAAVQTGLPATSRQHRTPIPGYSLQESVNILWGRDDLIVQNDTDQDLYLVWRIDADEITVAVVPVSDALPLPPLPDWWETTVAMVYGRPGPGGWGSLGQTGIVDHGLHLARSYGGKVDGWNGDKTTTVAVNPNVVMAGKVTKRDLYVYNLIAEARRQGYYVMLDVQTGDAEPSPLFEGLMEKFLRDNVWFDWDIEHTAGGHVSAAQLNQVAAEYFTRRRNQGLQTPGIFGFYVFSDDQVVGPAGVRREYEDGAVVPIFDGFGGSKIAKTAQVLSLFERGPTGVMEFETRWDTRYDKISARSYYEAFPDALIFASQ